MKNLETFKMSSVWSSVIFMLVLLQLTKSALQTNIHIGAMIEKEHLDQLKALEEIIATTNLNNYIDKLVIMNVGGDTDFHDSYSAHRKACRMTFSGIAAMFGPMTSLAAGHVQSICNAFEIPHLQWRWDPRDKRDYFSISLYPYYVSLGTAYKDAVRHWEWDRFTILYEDNDGLTRLQEVLKNTADQPAAITIRKLELGDSDYITLLKELKSKGENRFIIDCNINLVDRFLHTVLQLQMISYQYHYFFTTLDLATLDLEDYKYAEANITAFQLIDPERPAVIQFKNELLRGFNSAIVLSANSELKTEAALVVDAFKLFVHAMKSLSNAQDVTTVSLSCDKVQTWQYGNSLLNYMKATKFEGLSGTVKYDDGERKDFSLDLVYLTSNGLIKAGKWDSKIGLNFTLERAIPKEIVPKNKVYTVVTKLRDPYVLVNASAPSGYAGFCVDLLSIIAKAKNFTFTIVPLTAVGSASTNWTGVMGQLMNREADIGIGDLTINLQREKVVDFTKPFLTLGITILYKKPAPKTLNLFSFLSPLSLDVWVYMIAAYLCVSFMLFVIARFSPYEWCNPHPCNPDTDEVENQFTVMNSLWFTIGSLMQQGCEIAPRALSTRLVAGMWWFFTLIMISSYTANLAAFLTVERMVSDINSAEDLAKQTKVKYGTPAGGATQDFFRLNKLALYSGMWEFMNRTPDVFMVDEKAAVEKIKKGDYAYITESTTVDYLVERNCDFMKVGGLLDSKGYGFATPQGSPLREMLTEEILRLKEDQTIDELVTKWWKKELGGGKCEAEKTTSSGSAAELGVENVGGVFVVLTGGVIVGFFVSLCEFIWKARKNAKKDKQTLCSEISEEFRFAVRCFGSKKSKQKNEDEITDNGLQFMPLTGYGQRSDGKEVYA
ncbi:glutamate receptor ionotropic, kainate 1-like [Physella acuta]|uniref:glutamate receptor ionotropic, kainate 1-like n=1 Tax=Physella acuta TaxID=109671 RepID=UPI0027DE175F|nr:glutamate receptor ionotropic, kainate 1-like [Physella acuta]